jgi:hypothetical protein
MRNRILSFVVLLLSPVFYAQQVLNNDSVLKLVKAGLSEDLIVTTVNSSPGKYDTSADAIIALKKAGAGDKVVAAMILKASGSKPSGSVESSPAPAGPPQGNTDPTGISQLVLASGGPPAGVDSIGVYYFDKVANGWKEVPAEVVNFKAQGGLKHLASAGVIKGEMTGFIGGNRSSLTLKMPASFILYVPEGRAPGEYQLLRLHANADSREFRAANGGIVHDTGGALRDVVDYTPRKIAPRVYVIDISEDFEHGEYGFLPPSDAALGSAIPTSTKLYSFALTN